MVRKMWGGSYSIYGLGQGSSHERVRLKQGLEEVKMLAKLISGGRAFHAEGAATAQVLTRTCFWQGSQLVYEEDRRAVGKEVIE